MSPARIRGQRDAFSGDGLYRAGPIGSRQLVKTAAAIPVHLAEQRAQKRGDHKSARPLQPRTTCCGSSLPFPLPKTNWQTAQTSLPWRIPGTRHIPFDNYTYLSS